MLKHINAANGTDDGPKLPSKSKQSSHKHSPLKKSTDFEDGDIVYAIDKADLKLEKLLVFKVIHRRYGRPLYLACLFKNIDGIVRARRFDDNSDYIYRHMD
jgi:hypothetical protein